ncbi:MAG: glutamine--fructose-6-phosphate aminotransferase [delta proteobacterium ML8_F1]|nr:MAG: glutamine--fructose-6-phosphate aminotransferase [delta proteobacterium ML8_F1]
MCGIVGYIGGSEALPVLMEGLKRLEYRGYDSAGIAFFRGDALEVKKCKGHLSCLEPLIKDDGIDSKIGIGHTRWATHGEPNDINAHPHMSYSGEVAVIHNGIIENYLKLKDWLFEVHGIRFVSETDTEIIAHLIEHFYEGDLLEAVYRAVDKMEGAYALGVISRAEPDKIIAVRKDSPLIVGIGEGENFLASDIPALLKYTRDTYLIENNEVVVLTKDDITIYDELKQKVSREIFRVDWDVASAEKEGFEHFTIKEIFEQPRGIADTLNRRLLGDNEILLDGIRLGREELEKIDRIYIVACGTAYHAGLVGKYAIEKFARIPVMVDVASEFRYKDPFVDDKTLFIAISQSGETIDTLSALREAKRLGARVLSVVNVVGSSVARDSDDVFYTWAGPEIGVASTKAYTTQLIALYLIALHMAKNLGAMDADAYNRVIDGLRQLPGKVEQILGNEDQVKLIASRQFNNENIFFIGRNLDFDTALEASLKLKEISYINSFAIQAGELKHGTIALVQEDTLVVAIATQDKLFEKTLSNIREVKARGAYVLAVAKAGNEEILKVADEVIFVPEASDHLMPVLSIIPLQLFAYYVSLARGNDVDKPRNLAKSVTVE